MLLTSSSACAQVPTGVRNVLAGPGSINCMIELQGRYDDDEVSDEVLAAMARWLRYTITQSGSP